MTHVFFPLIRLFVTFTYDLRTLFPANDSQQLDMSLVWTLCALIMSLSVSGKKILVRISVAFLPEINGDNVNLELSASHLDSALARIYPE
jgi:hypothetical protein